MFQSLARQKNSLRTRITVREVLDPIRDVLIYMLYKTSTESALALNVLSK